MGKKVVIIGSSGHAKVIIDIFEASKSHEIIGLIDPFRETTEHTLGYSILGSEAIINDLIQKHKNLEVIIAIGDNWTRNLVYQKLNTINPNINYATAIHPSASISNYTKIGIGTCIMPGVIINSGTEIGSFCILNTKSSIDHDCKMNEFSSLAPNVTIGGFVEIGDYTAISIGATIKDRIKIDNHTLIGAGSLILKNCEALAIYYGHPAKKIRTRQIGEKYF